MKPQRLEVQQSPRVEHLSEEFQLLFNLLTRHYLTGVWQPINTSILRELMFLMRSRGMSLYSDHEILHTIIRGLEALEDEGHIGRYVTPGKQTNVIRVPCGKVRMDSWPTVPELVKKLVEVFDFNYFVLDFDNALRIGQALRDCGYDWESRKQLAATIEALCKHPLNIIETFEHPQTQASLSRLTPKVRLIFESNPP